MQTLQKRTFLPDRPTWSVQGIPPFSWHPGLIPGTRPGAESGLRPTERRFISCGGTYWADPLILNGLARVLVLLSGACEKNRDLACRRSPRLPAFSTVNVHYVLVEDKRCRPCSVFTAHWRQKRDWRAASYLSQYPWETVALVLLTGLFDFPRETSAAAAAA